MSNGPDALETRQVDLDGLHDDVSRLRGERADAMASLRQGKQTLQRVEEEVSHFQEQLREQRERIQALKNSRVASQNIHETFAAKEREAVLMACLDQADLSMRQAIVSELQRLEPSARRAEESLTTICELESTVAKIEARLSSRSAVLASSRASMTALSDTLEQVHRACADAESRLEAMKAAEKDAQRALVLPYVDVHEPLDSWPELAGQLHVSLVFVIGDRTWPLASASYLARAVLDGPVELALFEVHGVSGLVALDRKTARTIEMSPEAPKVTPLRVLREVLGQFGNMRVSRRVLDVVQGPSGLSREKDLAPPLIFKGSLRKYQFEGFRWLTSNHNNKFGSLLADDMGLGKTIQTVCFLCYLKEKGFLSLPALVIAPTSLLQNWRRELHKWAPTLRVCEFVGTNRTWPKAADVVLTSYGLVVQSTAPNTRRAIGIVGALILDEAQRVKNHNAAVSKSCKLVAANCQGAKVALSGTPIENRLEEVHSIFDVILPDYLGTLSAFRQTFLPKKGKADAVKLRKVIGPFMLRRVKTDPAICPELPPKVDMRHDVALMPKQERLYKLTVGHFMSAISSAGDRRVRAAQIFAMTHALRKVCNHPASYATPPAAFKECVTNSADESGKTTCFLELLQGILQQGEKCLVFVQYLDMITMLSDMVTHACGVETVAFTGALDARKRAETVERFQTDPSCKVCFATLGAGGVGLNLTEASHVIHFDRCYNPAVEDQGSDRAHRIGQQRSVVVHRLIAEGTFEDRIDAIMQQKQQLREIFSEGASLTWLADYDDDGLRNLFSFCPGSRKMLHDGAEARDARQGCSFLNDSLEHHDHMAVDFHCFDEVAPFEFGRSGSTSDACSSVVKSCNALACSSSELQQQYRAALPSTASNTSKLNHSSLGRESFDPLSSDPQHDGSVRVSNLAARLAARGINAASLGSAAGKNKPQQVAAESSDMASKLYDGTSVNSVDDDAIAVSSDEEEASRSVHVKQGKNELGFVDRQSGMCRALQATNRQPCEPQPKRQRLSFSSKAGGC